MITHIKIQLRISKMVRNDVEAKREDVKLKEYYSSWFCSVIKLSLEVATVTSNTVVNNKYS